VNRIEYSANPKATVFASPKRSIIGFATDKEITELIPPQLEASPGTTSKHPSAETFLYTSKARTYIEY
jgi:hypothetical protein